MRRIFVLFIFLLAAFTLSSMTGASVLASPPEAPQRVDAVIVGDRVADIALELGFIPEGLSARASVWKKGMSLRHATQILGCPNRVTMKFPKTVSNFMKERGLTRLIVEKSELFCIYKNKVNPMNVVPHVKDVPGIRIEYVDFSTGVASAVRQVGKLFNAEDKAEELVATYEKKMRALEDAIPAEGLGKRVLVLNGTYFAFKGKPFVRVEAPGGYSDQFILEPLGCANVASKMVSGEMKVSKGHFNGGRLSKLSEANPDVIVTAGDVFAVQLALRDAIKRDPSLANVPAFKNAAIYALPMYVDSSLLSYPSVFMQWKTALSR